jgi:hypothetical protein
LSRHQLEWETMHLVPFPHCQRRPHD